MAGRILVKMPTVGHNGGKFFGVQGSIQRIILHHINIWIVHSITKPAMRKLFHEFLEHFEISKGVKITQPTLQSSPLVWEIGSFVVRLSSSMFCQGRQGWIGWGRLAKEIFSGEQKRRAWAMERERPPAGFDVRFVCCVCFFLLSWQSAKIQTSYFNTTKYKSKMAHQNCFKRIFLAAK